MMQMIKSSFFIMEIMKIFSTSNRKIILFLLFPFLLKYEVEVSEVVCEFAFNS